jgi:hypothetical protein
MSSNIEKAQIRTRAVRRVLKTIEMVDPATAQTMLGLEPEEPGGDEEVQALVE